MFLSDGQLKVIREIARGIEYGSLTINISANSTKLDLSIQKRVRIEEEVMTMAMDVQKDGIVCEVAQNKPYKKT